ncbi:hypothetical protein PMZ80_007607 [Knufia obscura]|uniref:Uncharacterized protein n=2 Tax=Knufia TaxID=430999 RepID=A0AAN8ER24_9EURO|nr:hypothetical protein PMZ80_007607 [Knufia obscura]KAK5954150.1 hypothetical protein OHC33_004722 [Knufia fluminis]
MALFCTTYSKRRPRPRIHLRSSLQPALPPFLTLLLFSLILSSRGTQAAFAQQQQLQAVHSSISPFDQLFSTLDTHSLRKGEGSHPLELGKCRTATYDVPASGWYTAQPDGLDIAVIGIRQMLCPTQAKQRRQTEQA